MFGFQTMIGLGLKFKLWMIWSGRELSQVIHLWKPIAVRMQLDWRKTDSEDDEGRQTKAESDEIVDGK